MKSFKLILIILFLFYISDSFSSTGFLDEQKKNPRVKVALSEKSDDILNKIKSIGLSKPEFHIYIRIFKYEQLVQLWIKKTSVDTFSLIQTYPFSANSGDLGPKRKQGDLQIPEGFYHIDTFNPYSIFYISLGINYPNRSDRILGDKNTGGDIFIHGNNVTIGCVPITDDKIKELYLFAVYAKESGQNDIPVHIFPYNFNNQITRNKIKNDLNYRKYSTFWLNLEEGYQLFEKDHKVPSYQIDESSGDYNFD